MADTKRILALVAALLVLVALPSLAGNSWVADGDSFDLKDLADGETRTFGEGDDQVRATRNGDTISIEMLGDDDARTIELQCGDDDAECRVIMSGDDDHSTIMIRSDGGDDHKRVEIRRIVTGDGDGDHEVLVDVDEIVRNVTASMGDVHVMTVGEGEGNTVWVTDEGENVVIEELAGHGDLMFIGEHDGLMVRCPEGDTTMRLDKDDADGSFYCPKHNVVLEKVEHNPRVHRIKVQTVRESDEM